MGEIKSDFLTEGMDGEMMAKAKARRTLHDDKEPLQGPLQVTVVMRIYVCNLLRICDVGYSHVQVA